VYKFGACLGSIYETVSAFVRKIFRPAVVSNSELPNGNPPKNLTQAVRVLTYIHEVPGSNLSRDADYND
jgi:hypothetical protein